MIHGALDTFDPTTTLGEFIDQEHLMHIVARQTIRCREQDTCKGGHGGLVPEAIEPWAVELGPAIAVIALAVLLSDMPLGLRHHRVAEAAQVLFNRLLLLLTRRRDTGVQSDFHRVPPSAAMAQGWCLRRVP
jgi:hypothetical protein